MYFLLSVGFAFTANLPQVQLLSNWFVLKRGLAMGFSHAAQGFAPIVNIFTPLLIAALGWRGSYLALAGVVLLLRAALRRDAAARSPQREAHRARRAFSHL